MYLQQLDACFLFEFFWHHIEKKNICSEKTTPFRWLAQQINFLTHQKILTVEGKKLF